MIGSNIKGNIWFCSVRIRGCHRKNTPKQHQIWNNQAAWEFVQLANFSSREPEIYCCSGNSTGFHQCRKSATVVLFWPHLQPLWYPTNTGCKIIKQTKNNPVIAVTWVSTVVWRIRLAHIFWVEINALQGHIYRGHIYSNQYICLGFRLKSLMGLY